MRTRCLVFLALLVMPAAAGAQDWPAFRGPAQAGTAPSARPPVRWTVDAPRDVAWSTALPGLGHSSPIVWGDRVYVTTAAASSEASRSLRLGDSSRAGIGAAPDQEPHRWMLIALDRETGRVVWERTAHEGVPRVRRHVKASHASATPATDGQTIVALFGSEGLVAFDRDGRQRWRVDLGRLAVGLANDPTYEWGPASSPVIVGDLVVVQNDRYEDSALAAFDLATGAVRWRAGREELPAWSTPLAQRAGGRTVIVTNSPRFIRGHDGATGRELWQVADPEGEVKVSTPVGAGDLVIVTGGYPSAGRPIRAIRTASGEVAWQLPRGSPYTSTPLVYDGLLYIVTDNGILSTYRVETGARVYQQRVATDAGGFSASPIAADGRVYLTSEDGQIYVVRAGERFELLAANDMGEVCMATPALSGELLIVRTATRLYAIGGGAGSR